MRSLRYIPALVALVLLTTSAAQAHPKPPTIGPVARLRSPGSCGITRACSGGKPATYRKSLLLGWFRGARERPWKRYGSTLVALVVLLLAPATAHAEPQTTRTAAEATIEQLLPLLVGDFDDATIRCRPATAAGTWICSARWWLRTDAFTITRCRNPAVLDEPELVNLDDSRTVCRGFSHARRVGSTSLAD